MEVNVEEGKPTLIKLVLAFLLCFSVVFLGVASNVPRVTQQTRS